MNNYLMNTYEEMLTAIKQHLQENPGIKLAIYDRDNEGFFGHKASDETIWETLGAKKRWLEHISGDEFLLPKKSSRCF